MQKEFLVIGRANATTRQGSPYALLKVADVEQSFSVSVWDVAPDMAPFPGQLVQFVQVKDFGGKKSCSLTDMVLGLMADEEHPLYGLIPRPINRKVWDGTIANLLSFCTDATLVPIIQDFAGKLYKPYSEYPAATTVHHAYQGGLLNHTIKCCTCWRACIHACLTRQRWSAAFWPFSSTTMARCTSITARATPSPTCICWGISTLVRTSCRTCLSSMAWNPMR